MGAITAQSIAPVGPVFTHHLKIDPEITSIPEVFDFELSVVVTAPITAAGRVHPSLWPAMKAARTIHHGEYEALPAAWGEFMKWIKTEGLKPTDDLWESYVTGPHSDPDPASWRTELSRPLLD